MNQEKKENEEVRVFQLVLDATVEIEASSLEEAKAIYNNSSIGLNIRHNEILEAFEV